MRTPSNSTDTVFDEKPRRVTVAGLPGTSPLMAPVMSPNASRVVRRPRTCSCSCVSTSTAAGVSRSDRPSRVAACAWSSRCRASNLPVITTSPTGAVEAVGGGLLYGGGAWASEEAQHGWPAASARALAPMRSLQFMDGPPAATASRRVIGRAPQRARVTSVRSGGWREVRARGRAAGAGHPGRGGPRRGARTS